VLPSIDFDHQSLRVPDGRANSDSFDNDRGLVVRHDRATREVEFNAPLHALCQALGVSPARLP
jgi:hypothetical protein